MLELIDTGASVQFTGMPLALESEVVRVFDRFDHWTKGQSDPATVRRLLTMTCNLPDFTREPPVSVDPQDMIDAFRLRARPAGAICTEFWYASSRTVLRNALWSRQVGPCAGG